MNKTSHFVFKRDKIAISTYVICHTIIFLCVVIFFLLLAKNTIVASASMEPTLMTGDYVMYNRIAYKLHPVERGDIICFYSHEFELIFSKRVVGIAGDTISFNDGFLFINGQKAIEDYIPEGIETNCAKTFVVPENTVFVLGDNRENSHDSRFWVNPYISTNDIYGKYAGSLHLPW